VAGVHHDIKATWNGHPGQPENLADSSTNPISFNGHSDLSRSGEADAAVIESIGKYKHDKGARYLFCAPFVDRLKFSGILEPQKMRGFSSSAQP
jgi:hypothetical protein